MKIALKIEPETLFLLHKSTNALCQSMVSRRQDKSMDIEIFEMLTKRCFSYQMNPDGKPLSLKLRYHLADRLYKIALVEQVNREHGTYERNKLEIFRNELHQKLL